MARSDVGPIKRRLVDITRCILGKMELRDFIHGQSIARDDHPTSVSSILEHARGWRVTSCTVISLLEKKEGRVRKKRFFNRLFLLVRQLCVYSSRVGKRVSTMVHARQTMSSTVQPQSVMTGRLTTTYSCQKLSFKTRLYLHTHVYVFYVLHHTKAGTGLFNLS